MSVLTTAYKHALKPFLFRFDAELIHDLFINFGEFLGKSKAGQQLVRSMYGYRGPDVSRTVDGITYPTPVILAAGFDYNARLTQILGSVGFGGVEVGSVTAYPCEGNEPPRLRRAIKSESLVVYKGLKNDGVDIIIERLRRRGTQPDLVLGISIAMTNAESSATLEGAIDDYYQSLSKLTSAGLGDYYTINISCPNVSGGEGFTDPDSLRQLLTRLSKVEKNVPRYAKMPISAEWPRFAELLDILQEFDLDGAVVGNLNKNYDSLAYREEAPREYRGGLSGRPCRERSTELVAKTRDHCGSDFTIMGCGGIMTPQDALDKLNAGADLVQLISGMIFEGPHLMKSIAHAIARQQRRTSVNQKGNLKYAATGHGAEI